MRKLFVSSLIAVLIAVAVNYAGIYSFDVPLEYTRSLNRVFTAGTAAVSTASSVPLAASVLSSSTPKAAAVQQPATPTTTSTRTFATEAVDATIAAPFKGRNVRLVIDPPLQGEGDGAFVRRAIGNKKLHDFDPFLMLDDFTVQKPAGFPDHPHRGFETVTFILPFSKGTVKHEDFAGNAGTIGPGDVQWMTAGKGIMHAEMPGNEHPAEGLQLWVNLAAKHKMVEPAYQDLHVKDIPTVIKDGISAYIIAGTALGRTVDVRTLTPAHYIYYTLQPGAVLRHALPAGWNAFVYTVTGVVSSTGATGVTGRKNIVYEQGNSGIEISNTGNTEASFALIAGQPLNEPISKYGPFVMNTKDEIMQARTDFHYAANGFERVRSWNSKIAEGR